MKTLLSAGVVLALCASSALFAKGQPEPGDVKGEGKGHQVRFAKGQPEPGDVKGEGKGHTLKLAKGQPEPGDVKGEGKGHA